MITSHPSMVIRTAFSCVCVSFIIWHWAYNYVPLAIPSPIYILSLSLSLVHPFSAIFASSPFSQGHFEPPLVVDGLASPDPAEKRPHFVPSRHRHYDYQTSVQRNGYYQQNGQYSFRVSNQFKNDRVPVARPGHLARQGGRKVQLFLYLPKLGKCI